MARPIGSDRGVDHILGDRLATIERHIKHFENENRLAAGADQDKVDPKYEIELQDVYYLGCAYIDRALARNFVRIAGDRERPEALRKLSLINENFEGVYTAFRSFDQAYRDQVDEHRLIIYDSRTPFLIKFIRLRAAINKLPSE